MDGLTWLRFLALGVVAVAVRGSIPSERAGQVFVVLSTGGGVDRLVVFARRISHD
ncbi:MAG: hypothetical protein ACR2HM_07790 [Acidimicrobiales bacterium]